MTDTMVSDDYLRAAIHIFNAQVVERLHGVIFDPELGVIEVVSDPYPLFGEDDFENRARPTPMPSTVTPRSKYDP
jgi:hypothetical protein